MVSAAQADERSVDGGRKFLTPFGRELVVSFIKGTAMYRINYADGGGCVLPDQYSGCYTKIEYVVADIEKLLKEMWEEYRNARKEQTAATEANAETKDQKVLKVSK